MTAMRKLIWITGLWLVGIGQAFAFDLNAPETLKYNVSWGPIRVGSAQLEYQPAAQGAYTLTAAVKDDSSLIDLNDTWQSLGSHKAGQPFMPAIYSVKQAENSYRADKTMTFDTKSGMVSYLNRIDLGDAVQPFAFEGARDALATAYAWRMGGLPEVQKAAQVSIVTIKKLVVLQREAGVRETLALNGKDIPVWRVRMTTVKDGKTAKDSWTVYLSDDANLTPVQIVASTKFGTFRATLLNHGRD